MELLQALGESGLAAWLRRPGPAYPLANAAHILALALLVGSILVLDLRLLGLFGRTPVGVLGRLLSRVAAVALMLAIATGAVLLSVRPVAYFENPAFRLKLVLVVAGIINALGVRLNPGWRAALAEGRIDGSLRLQALISLGIWVGVVIAGRWIGFLM